LNGIYKRIEDFIALFWRKNGDFGKAFKARFGFIIKRIKIILMRSTEYNSNLIKNDLRFEQEYPGDQRR